jgi:hypothetical protein
MAVTLNASTSSGFVQSADTSGEIVLQNNGTTRLTVNASGVTIPTLTATTVQGTIVLGTAVSPSGTASIDFTGLPSWVKRITVMFDGVSSNSTSNYLIQLGTSGGVEATGYTSLAKTISTGVSGTTIGTTGFAVTNITAAATLYSGSIVINLQGANTWLASGILTDNGTFLYMSSGIKATAATLDRVRITTVNGTDTFDAGTINIQYEG